LVENLFVQILKNLILSLGCSIFKMENGVEYKG
jgi:hypothetical protein